MRVRFAGATDVGRKREHNEDAVYLPNGTRLAIVADGMGGHAAGDVASQLAVDTIVEHFVKTDSAQPMTWPYKIEHGIVGDIDRMVIGIMLANARIFEKAQTDQSCKGMGTTVVALYFLDDTAIIGHVGDSRVYRYRGGELTQLTEDHSLINDYVKMKRMTAEEAEQSPIKNVVVRALGMKETVKVDIITEQPRIGDCYLMCSDGLSAMLPDDQIEHIVRGAAADIDNATEKLISGANEEGGIDNVTVVLARIEPV
jgi:protein phosphatase